ncbi:MAG TPA: rhodanese-like domain-containing protein [Verrucomicrobiae bacterium]|jgi:rhodanese-related sulfurtransferase
MRNTKTLLLEVAFVAAAGLIFALAANALSPRGLRLGRNYFPGGEKLSAAAQPVTNATASPAGAAPGNATAATIQRLQQRGLQVIPHNEVAALFRDPSFQQGLVVFLDARDDDHYQAGHIPGAWQFDHYHPERHFPVVLPACLAAQKIVVYCNGGACEDSEFAAVMLRDAGIRPETLFVYAGGISEWTTNGQPVETGARLSGQLLQLKP